MKYPILTIFIIYLCLISLIAIILTAADKIKAKRGKWRVPEATLLIISALGGSAAMYIAMLLIRHKTKHVKFMLGIPIIIILQVIVVAWFITRYGLA